MDLDPTQIATRARTGSLDGNPVFHLVTKGGFNVVAAVRKGKVEYLGYGPHRGVARHIAKKRCPQLQWNDLEKSEDDVDPNGPVVARYMHMTELLAKATK